MFGSLSVPSGRFARGTVLLASYFLCKAGLNGTLMGKKRRILEKTVTQEFTPSAELSPN